MRNRFKVKLELFIKSVSDLLTYGYSVVMHVGGSAFFAVPHPALADVTTALDELLAAKENANGGGLVETSIMYDKRLIVIDLLTELGHYVEDVANESANAEQEETVIESAGMLVKGFSPRQKRVFSGMAGKLPGEVILFAASVPRGTHEWQFTTTPGDPDSWTSLTSTTRATKFIDGLTSLTVYFFRHRAILKTGPEPWDNPLSVIVL